MFNNTSITFQVRLICCFIALLTVSNVSTAQDSLEIAFTIREKELIPEGLTWDERKNHFYLSSIAGKKIIRIDEKGNISDFVTSGRDGLGEVVGITVNPQTRELWACSNMPDSSGYSAIHVFDLENGGLIKKYVMDHKKQAHFFNDLFILSNNDVFITDSEGNGLYTIAAGTDKPQPFIPAGSITFPNGITASEDETSLYVASSSIDGIVSVNLQSKEVKPLPSGRLYTGILDGLYRHGKSLIGIQNVFFPEMIIRYELNEKQDSIAGMKVMASDDPRFSIPTTGAIAGDWFYFIGNSNVHLYEKGVIRNKESLKDVYVLRMKMK